MFISEYTIKNMVDSLMKIKENPDECLETIAVFRDETNRIQSFLDEQEEYFVKLKKFTPSE